MDIFGKVYACVFDVLETTLQVLQSTKAVRDWDETITKTEVGCKPRVALDWLNICGS